LSWAAENGYDSIVKLLLETRKVDIYASDDFYQTPLCLAAINGYDTVVDLLVEIGNLDVDNVV
jgi:ankyrin repeat domain-containing protein 50